MFPQYRFEKEWRLGTGIDWWDEGRTELNRVIMAYNDWQINGFGFEEGQRILAMIIEANKTWANVDGGEGWQAKLAEMWNFIQSRLKS